MISRIGFNDLKSLLELDKLCFPEPISFGKATLLYYLFLSNTINLLERDEDTGRIKGFVISAFLEPGRGCVGPLPEGHIITLDVHPDTRRRGIGTQLAERAVERLRTQGAARVTLEVAVSNESARNLYQRMGFRDVEIIEDYYRTEHGFEDAYFMQLLMG